MRVAVTGSSGHIGSAVTQHFRSHGEVVRLVRRQPREPDEARWDPETAQVDRHALEGLDAVVHLAGENVGQRWSPEVKRQILESRRDGTRLLAEVLAELERPPKVLVSQSAAGYYGDGGERVLHEDHPPGEGVLSEVCQAWEAAADPARDAGIRVVHPRPMLVLSRDGPPMTKLLPFFRLGMGGPIGRGEMWWSWILREDFVRFVAHAVDTPSLRGPVNVATPAPVRMKEFAKALGEAIHRPAVMPAPPFALKAMYKEMADEVLLASQRLGTDRLTASGFTCRHPELREALAHAMGARATAGTA